MSVAPFPIQVLRDSKWSVLQTDELLPGDVVSLGICLFFYKAVFHTLIKCSPQPPVRDQYSRGHTLGSRDVYRQ